MSPLRGLDPFTEFERDVFQGRDAARDELAAMVTGEALRAGLLHGERGVGKTSLVRASLLPHLRDHGVIAVAADDPLSPARSLAIALTALGLEPTPGESPGAFLARTVSSAVLGQQFVFAIDEADAACEHEAVVAELADLFARVVSRSAGRARFLFIASSDGAHRLGALERRTGSLFPPAARFALGRFDRATGIQLLDHVLTLSGTVADSALAEAALDGVTGGQPALAADIQIAATALRDLRLGSVASLAKLGGGRDLETTWITHWAKRTSSERTAMRALSELGGPLEASTSADLAQRIGVPAAQIAKVLEELVPSGLLLKAGADLAAGPDGQPAPALWALRHDVLPGRLRELTAAARASARRAHDLLGSKTAGTATLSLRELWTLRAENIAPVTSQEAAVVTRSWQHYKRIGMVIAAAPVVALILLWWANRGHGYYGRANDPSGERVVVRAGRPGLSAFHWLPSSPGFGDVIVDTGLSRSMVAPELWKKVGAHDLGMSLDNWDRDVTSLMVPDLAGLVAYANGSNDQVLQRVAANAGSDPDALAEFLTALRPIARATPSEVALVEQALKQNSPAVQRAAVAVAGAAAQRTANAYHDTLLAALSSSDGELRRIAFTAVRGMGGEGSRALFSAALAKNPDPTARRELLIEVSRESAAVTPSPSASAAVLADPDATPALKERARGQLRRALAENREAALAALAGLIELERAPAEVRIFAIEQVRDFDELGANAPALANAAHTAFVSRSESVRAAALPLYAKLSPDRAIADLANLLGDRKQSRQMREATALAWGEMTRAKRDDAVVALEQLLKDDNAGVRAAAATAYGALGRVAQERLIKMVKIETFDVAVGAAEGLAVSAEVGASVNVAVDGIAQLWKQKGRARRQAVRIFARLAKRRPQAVMNFIVAAARSPDDSSLHLIGVEGLCTAANGGNAEARRQLLKVTDNPSTDVRRRIVRCATEGPEPGKNGLAIATRLLADPDSGIRAEAAELLAESVAKGGKPSAGVAEAIVLLLDDADRDVRMIAVRAAADLGADAPKTTSTGLLRAFERGDEGERLVLLRAASSLDAADVVTMALADGSPAVRIAAIDTALSSSRATAALGAALTDADSQVRRAALERLSTHASKLDAATVDRALTIAIRDPDPDLGRVALTTFARVGDKAAVSTRLGRLLSSRAEQSRAHAASAVLGLVDRDPALAAQLLEPLLADPSHDVRAAMLPSLAAAWAKTHAPDRLAALLRGAERSSMRRLAAMAAFVVLARTESGALAAIEALDKLAAGSPSMARQGAQLVRGLIDGKADGLAFLQQLVP